MTSDENGTLDVSGTIMVAYKIYQQASNLNYPATPMKSGDLSVTDEGSKVTISETAGTYQICVTATDHAGNTSAKECHEVTLKKIDVDVDGSGTPDFNDPGGDGFPDLNIKWKDPADGTKGIVINGARDNTTGGHEPDGIPDLNIDVSGNGHAEENLIQLSE